MSETTPRFTAEDKERNLRAAMALYRKLAKEAGNTQARFTLMLIELRDLSRTMDLKSAEWKRLAQKAANLGNKHNANVAKVNELMRTIRIVKWFDDDAARMAEIEAELSRPKSFAKVEFDPNWKVHGPNEYIESKKWWS